MKPVLDACCGSRMFWFDRRHPDVVFMDRREETHMLCDGRTLEIKPDVVGDFRKMPFNDGAFRLVVFDPPHLIHAGESSWLAKKYGKLDQKTWREDLKSGFRECFRVLEPGGILVFKWCEDQICAAGTDVLDRTLADYLHDIVPGEATRRLVGYMERLTVAEGDHLIRQDAEPDHLFFIESGQLTAQLEPADAAPLRLETMQGGRAVGELGFYLGTRRSAAVVADRPSVVYSLSLAALARIEADDPEAAYAIHRVVVHLLGERVLHLVRAIDALQG